MVGHSLSRAETLSDKPEILNQRIIAQTRIFRVEEVELRFANGAHRVYERLLGGPRGSVMVVPVTDNYEVLLVREYSTGSGDYQLGLPKGRIEAGEDPLQAANREICEEIGFGARRLELLRSFNMAPAYIQHQTHVILARELYPNPLPGDEPEPIEVVPWNLKNLDELLQRTDLTEARSIASLLLTRDYLL